MSVSSLSRPPVLGFIPASRGFFDATLALRMREQAIEAFEAMGVELVYPSLEQTRNGCVESRAETELVGALFRERGVDGIVVGAMNFGDEQGVALTVKAADLGVPVLIFGCQEEQALRPGMKRRDSFCGLLSIGEALRQIGVAYSVGRRPVGYPTDAAMRRDFAWFTAVCRVVATLRRARYGQVGARPEAFWTCRYDERALQRLGPTTVTLDLSELIGAAERLAEDEVAEEVAAAPMAAYATPGATPHEALDKMARMDVALRRWIEANGLDAVAIQCWTSIQQNFGICACAVMSRLTDEGTPAACEADILGTLSMHAAQLASGNPAALADWNNLHNDDDDLVNLWHCGVFPKSYARETPQMNYHDILVGAGAVEEESAYGIVEMEMAAMPVTLTRVTQDVDGTWRVLVVEAATEVNEAKTTGSFGWCRIAGLQSLYRDVLLRRYPHHVAFTRGHVGDVLEEAYGRYLGMAVDRHG
ncbi:MAG: L-fucose/L-arabinose isomerase family protein [Lentisphaerae bacterium]|nr:L-fucose/L-arabinose isomerase family protein [Lentisphaerota bacterium]